MPKIAARARKGTAWVNARGGTGHGFGHGRSLKKTPPKPKIMNAFGKNFI